MSNTENPFGIHRSQQEFEQYILDWWSQSGIPEQFFSRKTTGNRFVFYDGPPFATGSPHYGHLLAGTIKDTELRYQAMSGLSLEQSFGWDAHGIPIEHEVEKSYEASLEATVSLSEFSNRCRSVVQGCDEVWRPFLARWGRWIQWEKSWKTMDLSFMESVWWVFKTLYEKGHVYEGHKVLPFSWKLGTPLSNFEAGENYKNIQSTSLFVKFPLLQNPETKFLAWTTTPWTLLSNLALMVHPDLVYCKVRYCDEVLILCKSCISILKEDCEILEMFQGSDLEHVRYVPPFSHFLGHKNAFQVFLSSHVTDGEGTGIVHSAPGFGEEDFLTCAKYDVAPVCPVSEQGLFTEEIKVLNGQHVLSSYVEEFVCSELTEKGLLFAKETVSHRYPHCWRSDTPLIYRLSKSWFLSVEPFREQLSLLNKSIRWFPEHLREGRFGKWLEQARDWAISRNRIWGNPIPVWRSQDGETIVVGSRAELADLSGVLVNDLHRDHVDSVVFEKNGKIFRRISVVFDCWFESGSVPFAHKHYPFCNEKLEEFFPADFIAEGIDQTRGWFYTLHVLATLMMDSCAFRNVITNGIVLTQDGQKMSKRLKNYPDPKKLMDTYGVDAIRLYLLRSSAAKGESLSFAEEGVLWCLRQIILPLRNTAAFLVQHAPVAFWKKSVQILSLSHDMHVLDRWLLSRTYSIVRVVHQGLASYDMNLATFSLPDFMDDVNNWYVRCSRSRFKQEDDFTPFHVLRHVLSLISSSLAPIIPFTTEGIFQLVDASSSSVHLTKFPVIDHEVDLYLEEAMRFLREIVQLGHCLRKTLKIRVRQPLKKGIIATECHLNFLQQHKDLIATELNIKCVEFCPIHELMCYRIKPNYRSLGKRLGSVTASVAEQITGLSQEQVQKLLAEGSLCVWVEAIEYNVSKEDVIIEQSALNGICLASGDQCAVTFDTHLTQDLLKEGVVRECISKINLLRKEQELVPGNLVNLVLTTKSSAFEALSEEQALIKRVCYIDNIEWKPMEDSLNTNFSLEGEWGFRVEVGL